MASSTLLNLPVEIISLIFPYLDATSFLNLTATCHALHQPDFLYDSVFWAQLVRRSFRVPNRPAVQNDGQHWYRLCKRLLTETRIYTWGDGAHGRLGHRLPPHPRGFPPEARRRHHSPWPEPIEPVPGLGIVADLQCGGWSTTFLNTKGALYSTGLLDGDSQTRPKQGDRHLTVPLRYPPGFPPPTDRYDPTTAIDQFSSGRQHVLGLSDSGRIWTWGDIERPGVQVKLLLHDVFENRGPDARGTVKKVFAGWNKSAALVRGTGIVVWQPVRVNSIEPGEADSVLVLDTAVVPKTDQREGSDGCSEDPPDDIGEVTSFVVLEDFILFCTRSGSVFAAKIHWNDDEYRIDEPAELILPHSSQPDEIFVTDVQGSFRSFATFTRSGSVLTSQQDRVAAYLQPQRAHDTSPRSLFDRIPALQNKAVIQVAFGDHHFHALHAPGYITSYGRDPQWSGAFGLGGSGNAESSLRGIRYEGNSRDRVLVPHAAAGEGRRIWFAPEKREWCTFLASGGVDPAESVLRQRMAFGVPQIACHGEVSEWIEQASRDWEGKFGITDDDGSQGDGLGAYFALSVAAAGWHSGALVLVNKSRAEKLSRACEEPVADFEGETPPQEEEEEASDPPTDISYGYSLFERASSLARWFLGMPDLPSNSQAAGGRGEAAFQRSRNPIAYGASPRPGYQYVWASDHFPRLVLSDGTEMPGTVEFDTWRYGRPEWRFDY